MAVAKRKTPARGIGPMGPADKNGDRPVDPSENVKALSEASALRQDDLRDAAKELSDTKHLHEKEIGAIRERHQEMIGSMREMHQEKVRKAESDRLDSIRQVDREEVAKTAVAANTASSTLAKQTTDLANTLQKTVADTATAAEARNSATYTDVNKRLSALELSSSEGKGKQAIVDPQMDKLTALVETMARNQYTGTGKAEGINSTVALVVGGVTLLAIVIGAIAAVIALRPASAVAPVPLQIIERVAPATAPAATNGLPP